MAKQPTKQHLHSWAVYHIKRTPAKLVGIVYDQPDADAAIKQVIKEYNVPPNERCRPLPAQAFGCSRRRSYSARNAAIACSRVSARPSTRPTSKLLWQR